MGRLTAMGHMLALNVIDKLIIIGALALVMFTTAPRDTAGAYAMDLTFIAIAVFGSYISVILIVNLLTLKTIATDRLTQIGLSVLIAGFTMWLFPIALQVSFLILWLMTGSFITLAVDVETVLLATIIIRSFLKAYFAHRWRAVP